MSNTNLQFEELSIAKINEQKSFVLSKYKKSGGYVLAQRVTVNDGGGKVEMFLKNPYRIDNENGLCSLRDALNVAIEKIKNKE